MVPGDLTGDGAVGVADVVRMLRLLVGLVSGGEVEAALADVDCDGRLALGDVILTLRRVVGRVPDFSCWGPTG